MIDKDNIINIINNFHIYDDISYLNNGHLRIQTKFMLPDSRLIDIYIKNARSELFHDKEVIISDLGSLSSILLNESHDISKKKYDDIIKSIITPYNIRKNGAFLECNLKSITELPTAMIDLSTVMIRIFDSIIHKKRMIDKTFIENFEKLLIKLNYQFSKEHLIPSINDKTKVDYYIKNNRKETAVLTLYQSSQRDRINEVFRRWYELRDWENKSNRLTIYDDSKYGFKKVEVDNLIGNFSLVIPGSKTDEINDVLQAA